MGDFHPFLIYLCYMIKDIINNTYGEYLDGLDIYEDSKSIKIPRIIVKEEYRNEGIGSKIMNDIVDYADKTVKIITLTPSSDFGGNKNRLIQFYKKFGFKLNRGGYKSYEYSDYMIRYPKLHESIQISEVEIKGHWGKFREKLANIKSIAGREKNNTMTALNILKKGIKSPESITDEEKNFVKGQSVNIAKIIGVTATGTVSMLIPLAIEKLVNKWGFSILPKDQSNKLSNKELNEGEQKKLIRFNLRRHFRSL